MKILKFNESEQNEISESRLSEIEIELSEFNSNLYDKNKKVESLIAELNTFKNSSDNKNDQIDDSISLLQTLSRYLEDSVDNIDSILINIDSYSKEGRKFLYSEAK